jgi:predicted transcriptional regulator of viral defense system
MIMINQNQTLDLTRYERFKAFARCVGEIFDVIQAAIALNLSREEASKLLARWHQQGLVLRLQKGLYTIMPNNLPRNEFTLEDPWIIIPKVFGTCYVAGFSALEYWDLTEQIFNRICVLTTQHVKSHEVKIGDQRFLVRHIPEKYLFGLQTVWRKQEKVLISDIHRTIIDMFDNPENGGGLQHTIDCLHTYLRKSEANLAKLFEYAQQLANGAVFKRLGYLLSMSLVSTDPLILEFEKHITQGYAYLDPKQKTNVRLIKRWNLFIPQSPKLGSTHDSEV